MPSDEQAAAVAWNTVGGSGSLGYDIANSDCILAVGANFMDSWGTVAHNRAVFKETHPTGENAEQAIYYAGAMQNNTAVVADTWLPVKPGTEEIFLGAVLSELIKIISWLIRAFPLLQAVTASKRQAKPAEPIRNK